MFDEPAKSMAAAVSEVSSSSSTPFAEDDEHEDQHYQHFQYTQQQQQPTNQQQQQPAMMMMMMMMKEPLLHPNDHHTFDDLHYNHFQHSYSYPVQAAAAAAGAASVGSVSTAFMPAMAMDHAASVPPWMATQRDATLPSQVPGQVAPRNSYPYYPTTESWSISSGLTLNQDPLSPTSAMTFAEAYPSTVPPGGNPLKVAGFTKLSDLVLARPLSSSMVASSAPAVVV